MHRTDTGSPRQTRCRHPFSESEPLITTCEEHHCCFGLSCRTIVQQGLTTICGRPKARHHRHCTVSGGASTAFDYTCLSFRLTSVLSPKKEGDYCRQHRDYTMIPKSRPVSCDQRTRSLLLTIMTRDVRGYETSGNIGESLESSHGASSERRRNRPHTTHPLGRVELKKQEQQGMLRGFELVAAV
jgi:hypothetical protein